MKLEIKEKWLGALRSGEYNQGKGALRINDSFCCLGVLADIYSKDTGAKWKSNGAGQMTIESDNGILPTCIMLWAGLKYPNPQTQKGSLANLNDWGKPFIEIADVIEKEL